MLPKVSPTPSNTPSNTATITPSATSCPSFVTPSFSATPTMTRTPAQPTNTPTVTPTKTPTPTNPFTSEYQQILSYARTQGYTIPSDGQQILQNQLILDLINNSIWNELDFLYITATDGDQDFATINWVDPGNYSLTRNGGLTFTSNAGYTGNGSTGYLNTNFNPTTVVGTRVPNAMGAWVDLQATGGNSIMGSFVSRRQHIIPIATAIGSSATFFAIDVTAATNPQSPSILSQTDGLWEVVNNSSLNQIKLYRNSVDLVTPGSTYTTGTMDNGNILLLARQRSGSTVDFYSNATIKAAYLGQEGAFTNNIYTYLDTYISSI